MIHLSKAALAEVKRLHSKQQHPDVLFRLGVQIGGCSGLYYTMEFDCQVKPDDRVYECDGIRVVVDRHKLDYINGLSLDYSQDLMGGGFRFHNPNATNSCGCGNSFDVGEPPQNSGYPPQVAPQ